MKRRGSSRAFQLLCHRFRYAIQNMAELSRTGCAVKIFPNAAVHSSCKNLAILRVGGFTRHVWHTITIFVVT
jgi:hypothetical protein